METVNKLIDKAMTTDQQWSEQPQIQVGTTEAETITDDALVNINKIFSTLRISYPAWYAKHYGNKKTEQLAKRIWLTGIKELSVGQVDRGLQRLVVTSEFPPSLFEFVKLCKQVDGVPTLDNAFYQALSGNYKHDVVKYACRGLEFDLRRGVETDLKLKERFEYNYSIMIDRFSKGEPLDKPINPAIEHTQQTASYGVADDLIRQGEETVRASGKTGREAFKELKGRLEGVR